jgi:hypothetical protein
MARKRKPATSLLPHLAAICVERRKHAGIGPTKFAELAHSDMRTVWRFEHGEAWPRNPDHLVAVYAKVSGARPAELWCEAAERYAAQR